MRTWAIRFLALACLLGAGGRALAQSPTTIEDKKRQARELYQAGSAKYDFGRYQEAIELFTKSYETYPSPVLLFNIAQAHRQLGSCSDAIFFYTRYLEKKPDAPNRSEVEGFIADQKAQCAKPTAAPTPTPTKPAVRPAPTPTPTPTPTSPTPARSPTAAEPPPAPAEPTAATDDPALDTVATTDATAGGDVSLAASAAPRSTPQKLVAHVAVGPTFAAFGELDPAPSMAFALGAGFPIALGGVALDVGALLAYSPIGWAGPDDEKGTAGLTSVLANVGLDIGLPPEGLALRGELGLGLLVLSGADAAGNPFVADGEMATGALSFFNLRVALGVEYAFGKNLVLTAQPLVLAWSPTSVLRDEVSAITRYEMLIGVGYRL